jgi:hypothetical protein
MKQIEEEGFQNVLAVMPEHQRRAALLPGDPVEVPATKPRTQRAVGLADSDLVGDHRIGVLVLDAVRDAVPREKVRENVLWEIRLALVEIAGKQVHGEQAAPFEIEQNGKKAIRILASRKCDQPAFAGAQHGEILDRLPRQPEEPLAQLVEFHRRRRLPKHRKVRRDDVGGKVRAQFLHTHMSFSRAVAVSERTARSHRHALSKTRFAAVVSCFASEPIKKRFHFSARCSCSQPNRSEKIPVCSPMP